MDDEADQFAQWFRSHGQQHPSVGICHFAGMGRGAVALDDIAEGTVLFAIPRTLLLNIDNAGLRSVLTAQEWQNLHGWTSLILAMMWEYRKPDSLWRPYFNILPTSFDSLMFWSEVDLAELRGCSVVEKIGREEAMLDFHNIITPIIVSRPDIFGSPEFYTADLYNRMGSLVLSRSFHVEEYEADAEDSSSQTNGDASMANRSDASNYGHVSQPANPQQSESDDGTSDQDDDDEVESAGHVSMVPWADMLNARHGCDNARLFYEKTSLNMCATKPIRKGEQIWNVYGDPPNSDLLRRYGHVDDENPSDIVEIPADLVARIAHPKVAGRQARIDLLLAMDIDDVFEFTLNDHGEALQDFLAAISIFAATEEEADKISKKGRVSSKGLGENLRLLRLAYEILRQRLGEYPHDFEVDADSLSSGSHSPSRLRSAVIVRHGEMRILKSLLSEVKALLPQNDFAEDAPGRNKRILSKKELREEKKREREEQRLLDSTSKKRKL
ncbi:Ribosomal lysine N-methyltransferase 4 [Cystobasidiomycetes sp. EMM_F5]